MTVIYRLASPEAKDFTTDTFGTMNRSAAEFMAQVEAETVVLSPECHLYEVTLPPEDTAYLSEPLDTGWADMVLSTLPNTPGPALPALRTALLAEAKRRASDRTERSWMQVPCGDGRLNEAMVYVGERTIETVLAPPARS